MKQRVVSMLKEREVSFWAIAKIVYSLQEEYVPYLMVLICAQSVEAVLAQREVQHVFLTGMALDVLAEQGDLPYPLQEIIAEDKPLYSIDEILALAITHIYGSIGWANFGYLDKKKEGLIGRLHRGEEGRVNTFFDDLVASIAAAAAACIAHHFGTLDYEDEVSS